MTAHGLPRITRHAQLRALGLQPMVLRDSAAAAPEAAAVQNPSSPPVPAARPPREPIAAVDAATDAATDATLRLRVLGLGELPPTGADAALVQDLLACLGLTPAQVCWGADASAPQSLPVLAFGAAAAPGVTRLAALSRLRDPIEKRIAWPLLRRLRRALDQGAGAA